MEDMTFEEKLNLAHDKSRSLEQRQKHQNRPAMFIDDKHRTGRGNGEEGSDGAGEGVAASNDVRKGKKNLSKLQQKLRRTMLNKPEKYRQYNKEYNNNNNSDNDNERAIIANGDDVSATDSTSPSSTTTSVYTTSTEKKPPAFMEHVNEDGSIKNYWQFLKSVKREDLDPKMLDKDYSFDDDDEHAAFMSGKLSPDSPFHNAPKTGLGEVVVLAKRVDKLSPWEVISCKFTQLGRKSVGIQPGLVEKAQRKKGSKAGLKLTDDIDIFHSNCKYY